MVCRVGGGERRKTEARPASQPASPPPACRFKCTHLVSLPVSLWLTGSLALWLGWLAGRVGVGPCLSWLGARFERARPRTVKFKTLSPTPATKTPHTRLVRSVSTGPALLRYSEQPQHCTVGSPRFGVPPLPLTTMFS